MRSTSHTQTQWVDRCDSPRYSLTVTGPKYCLMAIEKTAAVIEEAKVEQAGLHEDYKKQVKFQIDNFAELK